MILLIYIIGFIAGLVMWIFMFHDVAEPSETCLWSIVLSVVWFVSLPALFGFFLWFMWKNRKQVFDKSKKPDKIKE